MSKTYKKENGKLKKTEVQTIETEYTREHIESHLAALNEKRTDQVQRNSVALADVDTELTEYQELLDKADQLNV